MPIRFGNMRELNAILIESLTKKFEDKTARDPNISYKRLNPRTVIRRALRIILSKNTMNYQSYFD